MSLQNPSVGTYPTDFTFWNSTTPKMKIINPEDFPREQILNGINALNHSLSGGFGNCDPIEAKERRDVMEFLYLHPDLQPLFEGIRRPESLPHDMQSFQTYFDPEQDHNPFWKKVHVLVEALEAYDELPNRIQMFLETLKSFFELEADEKTMAKAIAEMLESTAVFEGILDIDVSIGESNWNIIKRAVFGSVRQATGDEEAEKTDKVDPATVVKFEAHSVEFHGHRTFSFALSEARQKRYPKWTTWKWYPVNWLFGWARRGFVTWYNNRLMKKAFKPMQLRYSAEVVKDVEGFIKKMILSDIKLMMLCKNGVKFRVHFAYGKYDSGKTEGLRIRFIDASELSPATHEDFGFAFANFGGYVGERKRMIEAAQTTMLETLRRTRVRAANAILQGRIVKEYPLFFQTTHQASSENTDKEHKWRALSSFYYMKSFEPTHEAVLELRDFCRTQMATLFHMWDLLNRCVKSAEKIDAPITFPEIVTNGGENIIEFEQLYPMHLGEALQGRKVVPINNLPAINGTMIGLTGTHGGGKTVTEHTLVANIYLAQSGLPVLGQRFRLNPKSHLGMVFIEGVSGQSVCQLLVNKTANLFKGIRKVHGRNVMIVLDELGSATQESAGMMLAMKVLRALHERQVSLLFSTQITNVAEAAKAEFGAQCFRVDKKHRLVPGIGDGEIETVIKESGLAKYIN